MKNKLFKGLSLSLSLSANPISLIRGTFSAAVRVFTEVFAKISKLSARLFRRHYIISPLALSSLRAKRSNLVTLPLAGEGLHRPWYHKILGTRPRMTGGRGANSSGRSMIEMLGVLAIIAVLSVGGIAGYSKAMEKFRLNKWKAQIVDLVFSTKELYRYEKHYGSKGENLLPTLKKIGAIPQDMLDTQDKDIFGNTVVIRIDDTTRNIIRLGFYFFTNPSTSAEQNCRELYSFILTDPDVHAIIDRTDWFRVCGKSADEQYKNDYKCIDYDLLKIINHCKICRQKACTLILMYNNE